jgi:hypothetical protein
MVLVWVSGYKSHGQLRNFDDTTPVRSIGERPPQRGNVDTPKRVKNFD